MKRVVSKKLFYVIENTEYTGMHGVIPYALCALLPGVYPLCSSVPSCLRGQHNVEINHRFTAYFLCSFVPLCLRGSKKTNFKYGQERGNLIDKLPYPLSCR